MRLFTSHQRITPRRRVALTATLVAGLAIALGSGSIAANAATPSSTSTSPAAHSHFTHASGARTATSFERIIRASEAKCTATNSITAADGKVALRADRTSARSLAAGSARNAAFKAIHSKALSGGYGSAIQSRAETVAGRTGLHLGKLPAALVTDMKSVHAAAPANRAALDTAIANKANAGSYGAAVRAAAKKIEALGCVVSK
ncbi:MAG: hypothetical protein H7248_03705 [Microbacteriaceae bacterium]|nr:hypothetical protein [Microbacteriaceae bacterium]